MLHFSSHTLLIASELFSSGEALKKFLQRVHAADALWRQLQWLIEMRGLEVGQWPEMQLKRKLWPQGAAQCSAWSERLWPGSQKQ